jgi:hypothetical protein
MDAPTLKAQGHSALVRMELRLNGCEVPLAQMGPDFVVVKQPLEHPPADADIIFCIDDSETTWRVHLVEGISAQRRKTKVAPATCAAS